jgi:2-methylisocitrate lyase-like PEP mutase family enzyme
MTTRFKELFEQKQFFVMAGGMNPIGAKMAEVLGYEVFYMSGGNTSAHQLGWPDSGSSMRDMVDNARKIVLTVHIPVFADADQDTASLPQLAVPYRPAVGGENGTHIDSKIREA